MWTSLPRRRRLLDELHWQQPSRSTIRLVAWRRRSEALTHVRQKPPPGPQIEKRHWNHGFRVRVTFRSREDISRRWCADFGRWAPLRPAIRPIGYFPLLLSKIAQFADKVTHIIGEPRIAQTTE